VAYSLFDDIASSRWFQRIRRRKEPLRPIGETPESVAAMSEGD
jgi:hypothetical protein